jgi:hypothetical protein
MIMRKSFCKVKQLFAYCFFLVPSISLFANAPDILESKKLSVSFNIPAKNAIGVHEFYILDAVNLAGYYWKTSNDSSDNPNWSKERYNYRKTGNSTGNLTVINSSGEPTLLELSFSSSTTASCNLSFWSMTGGQLVKESHTGTATVSLSDLILSDIPSGYQVSEPSGYYAPASIAGGTLSAQDKYWSLYDETISFLSTGTFSASITNDDSGSPLSASGTSYKYTKTGINSATLSYSIDGAGISFEYALQFTGENTGIYSKYANYGSEEDITTGPFSLSGVAVPEQYDWEDYDDFNGLSLDTNKWGLAKWDGGNFPVLESGRLKFDGLPNSASSVDVATSAMLAAAPNGTVGDPTSLSPHSILEFKESKNLAGIELTFSMPSDVPNEMGFGLYAVDYEAMLHEIGQESAIRFSMDLWAENSKAYLEYDTINSSTGIEEEIDKNILFNASYRVAFIRSDSQISFYMNGELVGEYPYSSVDEYFIVRAMNEINQPFTTYLENVRVLRRSQETTEPDPVTVVSDPNGQAVVVQLGDEYKWSGTLDGVTLWGVWEDDEDGWIGATIKYENGMQKASIGITDQLGNNLEVNHPYIIDVNGMIKVTEDTAFQYYQVTAVENGVITTADGSSFPLSDTSKFFTTRAAAEEYYYSKANPKNWMWFDHYPWVYSNEEQDWLYFHPSGGTLMYWSNKGQAWRQFNP